MSKSNDYLHPISEKIIYKSKHCRSHKVGLGSMNVTKECLKHHLKYHSNILAKLIKAFEGMAHSDQFVFFSKQEMPCSEFLAGSQYYHSTSTGI